MHRGEILDTAKELTCGDRNEQYGPPGPQLELAGKLYDEWLKAGGYRYSLAHNEAIHQVFVKLSRIAFGQKGKLDTYQDAAAYVAIAGEIETTTVADLAKAVTELITVGPIREPEDKPPTSS